MTVDLCTRVWTGAQPWGATSSGPRAGDSSPGAHDSAMHCVDVAAIAGYRCERVGGHIPTERVAAMVNADPDHRVGFAGIDPGAPSAMDDLESAREQGMAAISIAPADQGVRPTDDRSMAVLEWCAARGMPVHVSNPGLMTSQSVLEYARPALFDEAARQLPKLTIVFGDLGRVFLDEALAMAGKHPRVFAEISTVVLRPGMLVHALTHAFERDVLDKLLFASGFPYESPERAIARVYSVNTLAGGPVVASGATIIPRERLRTLVERDSLALIGIEHDGAERETPEGITRLSRQLEVSPDA